MKVTVNAVGRTLTVEGERGEYRMTLVNEWGKEFSEKVGKSDLIIRLRDALETGGIRVKDRQRMAAPLALLYTAEVEQILAEVGDA